METQAFKLPQIVPDQAQKHLPVNWSLDLIDVALGRVVLSATTSTAPSSPAQGAAYIVPTGAAFGAVAAGAVAVWNAGAWHGFNMPIGSRVAVLDESGDRIRTAVGWMPGLARGRFTGAALGIEVRDAILTLSGASVTAANLIPARAIVLGVTSWTIQAVTGAPSYRVGMQGDADLAKFGGGLGVAVGSSNVGVVGPFATYAPAGVIVGATSGSFTGGRVGVAVSLLMPGAAPI